MTWYAIKDGPRVLRAVQQTSAPSEPHAELPGFSGQLPPGGGAGSELRETAGVLSWVDVDAQARWADVRDKRDRLLAGTDWITVRATEQSIPVPTAWATYRQALRDITAQSDPFNITWPSAPT